MINESSIKNKTLKGLKWSFIDNIAGSGVTFLVGLVLARLLSPAEFGIIGIILIFIAVSNTLIDSGFSTALIRKFEVSKEDYNTVFYTNLFIAAILIVLFFIFSNNIADFFKEKLLADVFPVMSFLLLINAFGIVQKTDLIRKIDFKKQAIISLIASVVSGIIGITLALLDFGVWSLVWQQLSRYFFITLLLWFFNNWRPTFHFSWKNFKELFGFSSKILGADLINTIYKNIFNLIIGKFYSTAQLGQYTRAEQFNVILTNNLTTVIQKVTFPTLSSVQNDSDRLRFVFRKFIIYSAFLSFPLVLGLGVMAKPLIIVTIGEKWLEASFYLQIMCLYGILYPLTNLNLNMLNVAGRSDIILKLEIIKKIFFIPVFVVGFYYGLTTMLCAAVIYYYIEFIFNSWFSERFFDYGLVKQIKDVMPILLISVLISSVMWLISFIPIANILIVILQFLIGLFFYIIVFEKLSFPEYLELKEIIQEKLAIK